MQGGKGKGEKGRVELIPTQGTNPTQHHSSHLGSQYGKVGWVSNEGRVALDRWVLVGRLPGREGAAG